MLRSSNQNLKPNYLLDLNLILISLAALLFTCSMFQSMQNELKFNDLGLLSSLPSTYFISIFFLIISFIISINLYPAYKYLLAVQTLGLIFFLFLMPLLVEGTPRFTSSFIIGGEIDYIIRNNFLNAEIVRYHNWPGAEIFGASFILLTNLSLNTLLSFAPFISQVLYFLIIFSLFALFFKDNVKVWVSCWIFFVSNWLNQDYFSPQNIAFFLYLIILLFLFKLVVENKHKAMNTFILIITFLSLVTTHVLTPFILLLNTLSLTLMFYKRKLNNRFLSLSFVILIIYLSWEIFGAKFMFPEIIHALQNAITFEATRESTVNRISSGSYQHWLVVQFRMYITLLLYFMAFIGFISIIHQKKNVIFYIMTLLLISALGLLGAGGYGGEIVIRIVLFSLVPLSYFVAHNFDNRFAKVLLIIFFFVSPLFHIIGHYGSETIDYTAPDDLKGANFFFKYASLDNSTIKCYGDELRSVKYIEYFRRYDLNSPTIRENPDSLNNYVWLTRKSGEIASFIDNNSNYYLNTVSSLNSDPLYNKIYSSKNFKVYLET